MPTMEDVTIHGHVIPLASLRVLALAMAIGTVLLIILTYVLTAGDDGGGVTAADYGDSIGSSAR